MDYYDKEINKKNNLFVKIVIFLVILALLYVILSTFVLKKSSSSEQKYEKLKSKLCAAAETYINNNQNLLSKDDVGKSTLIKYKTLAENNLIEAKVENPYYDGTLFKKGTLEKNYSMDNSVRLVVQVDGSYYCELVENANDITLPVLSLKGNREIVLAVGTEFEDPGYTSVDDYDGDITSKVVRSGNVDSSKAGTYEITYTSSDSAGNIVNEKRNIVYKDYNDMEVTVGSILDEVKPVISLKGKNPYCLEKGNKYVEPGAVAIDNVDGNITDRISITNKVTGNMIGTFRIIYKVVDDAGNESIAYRSVVVSTSCSSKNEINKEVKNLVNNAPVLNLIGKNSITIQKGSEYIDLGATAFDKEDGELTNKIVVDDSNVDVNKPGIYKVLYRVLDSANKLSTITRTVTVKDIVSGNPLVRFLDNKKNVDLKVNEGSEDLLKLPKAVDENGTNLSVTRVIEDYVTKQRLSSIDWSKAGKYRVIYSAKHGNNSLTQSESNIITIKNNELNIIGDSIKLVKRNSDCNISAKDLTENGIKIDTDGDLNPIITVENGTDFACTAGNHNIKISAELDGKKISKNIAVSVTDDNSSSNINKSKITYSVESSTTCGKTYDGQGNVVSKSEGLQEDGSYVHIISMGRANTGGYSVEVTNINIDENNNAVIEYKTHSPSFGSITTQAITCPHAIITFSSKPNSISTKHIEADPEKVTITSNSSNKTDPYNKNGNWVGGSVTGITLDFDVSSKPNIAYFEYSKNCDSSVDGKISTKKQEVKMNGKIPAISSSMAGKAIGTITWEEEGKYNFCIRAVSSSGQAGEWSDPVKMYLDLTGPKTEFTHTWKDGVNDWHNSSTLTLTYKSSDSLSGIDHYEYTYDDVKAKKSSDITTYNETSGKLTISENTEPSRPNLFVFVRAVDKAGNMGEWTLKPAYANIDTVAPTAPQLKFNNPNTVNASIIAIYHDQISTRPSGANGVVYTIDNGNEETVTSPMSSRKYCEGATNCVSSNKTYTGCSTLNSIKCVVSNRTQDEWYEIEMPSSSSTKKYRVEVWSIDKAGNRSSSTFGEIGVVGTNKPENTNEPVNTEKITYSVESSTACGKIYDGYGNVISKSEGKQEDGSYVHIISMGQRNTGGYLVEVTNVNIDENNKATIEYKTHSPSLGSATTQAITCPHAIITFSSKPNEITNKLVS